MEHVKSKFNFVVNSGENESIIFNSLRNTFSVVKDNEFNVDNFDMLPQKNIDFLKRQGIIVEENFDEDKEVFIKYMSIINNGVMELIILPTMNCNFNCAYCYEDRTGGKMSKSVMDSIVLFAQRNISRYSNLHVSWFGGEPLLCMDVIQYLSERLMKLTKSYHKTYSSNMTTNGYFLDVETFKTLFYKCKVAHYQITLDGREQFHNKTRPLVSGGPTYETIVSNLINIKNNVNSRLFTILIRSNLTKETLLDLKEQLKEHEENFGMDKRFQFIFKLVGDWGGDSVKEMYSSLISSEDGKIGSLSELLSRLNPKINLSGQFVSFDSSVCYAAKQGTFTITPTGKVMRCTVHIGDEYNSLGNIDEKGNFTKDEKYFTKWQYCAQPVIADKDSKCKKCPLYANCFSIMCPANHVKNGIAMNCNIENETKDLLAKYKLQPELFLRNEVR